MKLCECGCGQQVKNRFISGHNKNGSQNPNWKGGSFMGAGNSKYKLIYSPGHSRCCIGNHVLEQILIAEKALGKPLPPKAVVHHHTPTQLVVCQDQAYHMLIHKRTKAYNECGHANWLKCRYCKKYDDPVNLHICPSGPAYHKNCQSKHYKNSKRG